MSGQFDLRQRNITKDRGCHARGRTFDHRCRDHGPGDRGRLGWGLSRGRTADHTSRCLRPCGQSCSRTFQVGTSRATQHGVTRELSVLATHTPVTVNLTHRLRLRRLLRSFPPVRGNFMLATLRTRIGFGGRRSQRPRLQAGCFSRRNKLNRTRRRQGASPKDQAQTASSHIPQQRSGRESPTHFRPLSRCLDTTRG